MSEPRHGNTGDRWHRPQPYQPSAEPGAPAPPLSRFARLAYGSPFASVNALRAGYNLGRLAALQQSEGSAEPRPYSMWAARSW
jgi:hypothetical protein